MPEAQIAVNHPEIPVEAPWVGPSHYVAIGASAGGLEAIESFFTNMPAESGAAFIVIQHLSPDYLSQLVRGIRSSLVPDSRIRLEVTVEDFELDSRILFPVGIIANELVTNALKYAFPGSRPGRIGIALTRTDGDRAILVVEDDGVGLVPGGTGAKGFGLSMVRAFLDQIGGSIGQSGVADTPESRGTRFSIGFPTASRYTRSGGAGEN
jgi:signal transduction histidine kinase